MVQNQVRLDNAYYQFPIRALHFGCSVNDVDRNEANERLEAIEEYCGTGSGALPATGGNNSVRVRSDIFLDAYSWTWRDFAYLCAIYAGIGDCGTKVKRAKLLRTDQISAMACGFSRKCSDCEGYMLDRYAANRTINKLVGRNLFVRASADNRNFFYSHRMSTEEIASFVVDDAVERKRRQTKLKTDILRREVMKKLAAISGE